VWQWVGDPAVAAGYDGSAGSQPPPPFDHATATGFEGHGYTLLGGSWATTGDPATSVRYYAQRRHGPTHVGGFRYVAVGRAPVAAVAPVGDAPGAAAPAATAAADAAGVAGATLGRTDSFTVSDGSSASE
jgi:hypothetical protein